jgi:hypothetical protein
MIGPSLFVEVGLASTLSQDQLLNLARYGAQARLTELRNEIAAIEQAFPAVSGRRAGRPRKQTSVAAQRATGADEATSGRRSWSPAQRNAAAERMKSYWAKRKAARKK